MEFELWIFAVKQLAQTYEMSQVIYAQLPEGEKAALHAEFQKAFGGGGSGEPAEVRYDTRKASPQDIVDDAKQIQLMFRLNHTMPKTAEYQAILKELFENRMGDGSYVMAPLSGDGLKGLTIGRNCYISGNCFAMARGGITLEDDVQIADNVQLLSCNYDPYDHKILLCKPIRIKKGACIGAGATILPGVIIGKYAMIGAGSVVTRSVNDYEVAVGNPARVIKKLDRD